MSSLDELRSDLGKKDLASMASLPVDVRQYFAQELQELQGLARDGLVVLHEDGLEVTPLGWYFVRSVAMVFDRHLRADRSRERFSKVI